MWWKGKQWDQGGQASSAKPTTVHESLQHKQKFLPWTTLTALGSLCIKWLNVLSAKVLPWSHAAGLQCAPQQWWMESRSSPRDKNGAYRFNQGMTEVGRREKNKGWVTKKPKTAQKQNWLWIITCCGEAKLTVLGTSYAICVETPPMSRTPAVLFLTIASCWSLPGTCTSTTASPSSKNAQRKQTDREGESCDYCVFAHLEAYKCFLCRSVSIY